MTYLRIVIPLQAYCLSMILSEKPIFHFFGIMLYSSFLVNRRRRRLPSIPATQRLQVFQILPYLFERENPAQKKNRSITSPR